MTWIPESWIYISALVLVLYLYFKRNYNYWKKRGVKDVRPMVLFGNIGPLLLGMKTPEELIREVYDKGAGEKVIGLYVFGKPHLIVRDPELIKNIFIKDFNNFANKIMCGKHSDVMTSTNLFLASNPPWKNIRLKLAPIFTPGKLKKMYELMIEICDDFHRHLDDFHIDDKIGKLVEIKEICAKFTTDIIGTTAFGVYFNSLKDPEAEFRRAGEEIFKTNFKRYLQMLSIFLITSLRPFTKAKFFSDEASEFLRKTFWQVIDQRIVSGIKRTDLIDMLIDIKKNQENNTDDTFKLEGDALVAQAAVFFSGGFETSSTTMSFALYLLARNPEKQMKLRNEILNALKTTDGKVTYDMLTTLPYLHMVTLEALRMYPILPWLDRIPEEDYTISGTNITVEKGVPVILPMRSMHFDPKYFPNPEKFIPERFSEENKKNIIPFTYFPFGEGPRNCIGFRLGYIQTKLGILNFVSKYELTTNKDINLNKLTIFIQPKGGIYLNLRKIST